METDSATCPQKPETQDECISQEEKLHFTEDKEMAVIEDYKAAKRETERDSQDMKKEDKEAISGLEKSSFTYQPHEHHTSSPEDGAIEIAMEALSSTDETDLYIDKDHEWPPVPGLEDVQPQGSECQAIDIKHEVKENPETSEDVQTSMEETEGRAPATITPTDKGTDSLKTPKVTNEEEGNELESHGDSDSIVFLSENSEELNVDCKPVDFATTREQWVRRDSRDEPQNLVYSKTSSKHHLAENEPSCESKTNCEANTENVQQGVSEVNNPCNLNEKEVVQQVCGVAPPLETVADEPANPEQGNSACLSMEVKEPVITPQGRRDSEREEREGSETGEERKQTECFTETGGTVGKQLGEVKDQRQERENKRQSSESQSNTEPQREEGKVNRMQVDHFDDSQSDSGVSADFSPNSTTDVSEGHPNTDAPQPSESPPNETPIEREIRLAIKREQSLRRSRGLSETTDKTNEFVEIPLRRSILSQDLQIRPNPSLDKDRQFAGKKMQKEINAEVEREKVLVELGRLPGFYDKGTEVQLQEKKQLFESFQEPKESVAAFRRKSSSNSPYVESSAGLQEVDSAVDVRQRLMQFSQNSPTPPAKAQHGSSNGNPPASRGPGLTEGIKGQVIIIEANSIPITVGGPNGGHRAASWTDGGPVKAMNSAGMRASSAEPGQRSKVVVIEDEDPSGVKENPFFKLRSSMTLQSQVELDIQEAKKRERELQRQRTSVYGGAARLPEEEMRTGMDLRTEYRVKEERRSSGKEMLSPSPPQTNLTSTGYQSEMFTSSTSVRQSTGKLDLVWPPPQANEAETQTAEKMVKIQRQRNPLLERWEAGMVNGQPEDSD